MPRVAWLQSRSSQRGRASAPRRAVASLQASSWHALAAAVPPVGVGLVACPAYPACLLCLLSCPPAACLACLLCSACPHLPCVCLRCVSQKSRESLRYIKGDTSRCRMSHLRALPTARNGQRAGGGQHKASSAPRNVFGLFLTNLGDAFTQGRRTHMPKGKGKSTESMSMKRRRRPGPAWRDAVGRCQIDE